MEDRIIRCVTCGCADVKAPEGYSWKVDCKDCNGEGHISLRVLLDKKAAMEEKLIELKEQLRWRKWPDEKPEDGSWIVMYTNEDDPPNDRLNIYEFVDGDLYKYDRSIMYAPKDEELFWRPVGEVPGEDQ